MLNHPHIARKAVSTVFQRRGSASAMLNELFALADYPSEASGGAMLAEKMLVSLRMYNIISQTYVTISGSNSQISVREQFLKDHATIREIAVADELKDAGGTGVDGVFCYRDDEDGVSLVMPAGPTVLPMQGELYNLLVPFFGGIGGVLIPYAGHHIIGLVEVQ